MLWLEKIIIYQQSCCDSFSVASIYLSSGDRSAFVLESSTTRGYVYCSPPPGGFDGELHLQTSETKYSPVISIKVLVREVEENEKAEKRKEKRRMDGFQDLPAYINTQVSNLFQESKSSLMFMKPVKFNLLFLMDLVGSVARPVGCSWSCQSSSRCNASGWVARDNWGSADCGRDIGGHACEVAQDCKIYTDGNRMDRVCWYYRWQLERVAFWLQGSLDSWTKMCYTLRAQSTTLDKQCEPKEHLIFWCQLMWSAKSEFHICIEQPNWKPNASSRHLPSNK